MFNSLRVNEALEQLADVAEEHGGAMIDTRWDGDPLNLSTAIQYSRYYETFRRESQLSSIEHNEHPPEHPLFGWGNLAHHEVIVVATGEPAIRLREVDPEGLTAKEYDKRVRQRESLIRKSTPAALRVLKRDNIIVTPGLLIIRGVLEPTVVPRHTVRQIHSLLSRMKRHIKAYPKVQERVKNLRIFQVPEGALVRHIQERTTVRIKPLHNVEKS